MSVLNSSWQHDFIMSNGIQLHYVTQGEGKLMLMLHGFPEFWYSWRHQIPEFAKDYKVVALDLRGYNESDKPQALEAYNIKELRQDIEGVITGLGYENCILVGHDWGGAIAWNFAYNYPQMVERLIVLNIPHPAKLIEGLRMPQQLLKSWYIFFFQLPFFPEWSLQANDYQFIAEALQGMAIDKNTFNQADIEAYKDAAAKRGALTAMVNYYRNIFQGLLQDSRNEIEELEIPTLMIWGENDAALSKELTYETVKYVRNLTIKYISNCSHWVQQEQPQLVNQYMREFLENES
ncbi:alpha/beta hydrolase [Candidatus Gracilibacteria bacterium]|nr:alpha/beta hydrolase [Candidatus Gracilibacteria bacterium]NJM90072.1 alpha/beta hydrolase [Hydrococcus sp. RU_2_2]